jgi:hypothetical protein
MLGDNPFKICVREGRNEVLTEKYQGPQAVCVLKVSI